MRRRTLFFVTMAIAAMVAMPSLAFGMLTNEYGMGFAGQATCLNCHDSALGETVHGRFVKKGLVPEAPEGWTDFRADGTPPVVGAANPGSGATWFSSGGSYPVNLTWLTLGDWDGGSSHAEYIFFNGNTSSDTKVNPWSIVEDFRVQMGIEGYRPADPETGYFDMPYGTNETCQECHMLGSTAHTANSTATEVVPNPTVSIPATFTTAMQWARDEAKTTEDFRTDPTVSEPGMSIQCERCHGTGFKSTGGTQHWFSGTQLSHRIPDGTMAPGGELPGTTASTLGQSQVCGQCHGIRTDIEGTLGVYGYTPNLPLRDFADINGLDEDGISYTYTPTEAEFMANPTKYWMFPNGSNAKGSHFTYNEWSTSGHAYRGALTSASPDAMRFQADGAGHYNATTSDVACAKCHTGEGYLTSKSDPLFDGFTPTNANTGFMGQECITCHDAHPAAVGAETNIRAGDVAGVRSNTGLTTANSSVCEDCHNWQNEVLGTASVIKPLATIATRGGPSHPQREVLHGKVMLDVDPAGEFMPGAKCQECHMPLTDTRFRRYSHGMHIMLPGKAEEWNTAAGSKYNGEDSCSPCHPGETRSELQANIEEWQGDTTEALTLAGAAITAAQTRGDAEYSLTDATKPGYVLVGRATWNYKSVGSDGSTGAHNPEYVLDGLAVAKKMALSVGGHIDSVTPATVGSNAVFAIAGTLKNGDGSNAVGGKVTLSNGATFLGETTSDANGNFSFMQAQTSATTYTVKWNRSSQAITDLSASATVAMSTAVTPKWIVTLKLSKSSVKVNTKVNYSGTVRTSTGRAGSGVVTIQKRRASGGSWIKWRTHRLNASGNYSITVKMTKRQTSFFRAKMPGNAVNLTGYSAQRKLRVY